MESTASFREKTLDGDPDIRYMAVSDLNTMMEGVVKGDAKKPLPDVLKRPCDQKEVFNALLGLVRKEQTGTVQEQVQKCLYLLCACPAFQRDVCKDMISQLIQIVEADLKATDESANSRRESASLALREALKGVCEAPDSKDIVNTFAPKLLGYMRENAAAPDARVRACECFAVILQNGNDYVASNAELPKTLFQLMLSSTARQLSMFRKRLVSCIVALSSQLSDDQFVPFVKIICENISAASSNASIPHDVVSSLVQVIGAVAGTPKGSRLSKYLEEIIPQFITLCKEPSGGSMDDSDDFGSGMDSDAEALDELRSLVFQSCEILLGKCAPGSLAPLIKPLLQLVEKFVSYDPNYFGHDEDYDSEEKMKDDASGEGAAAGGGDDDGDAMSDGGDDDFGDDDFGSDFDDDDVADASWKIRRDSIRCFVAIASALVKSPEQFVESSHAIFSCLWKRLSDRDDSVRMEAISAVSSVIRSCSLVISTHSNVKAKAIVESLKTLVSGALTFAARVAQKLSAVFSDSKTSIKVRTCSVQLATALLRFDTELGKKVEEEPNKNQQQKFSEVMKRIWTTINESVASSEPSSTMATSTSIPSDSAAAALKVESLLFIQAFMASPVCTRELALSSVANVSKCIADAYVRCASEGLHVIPFMTAAIQKSTATEEDMNVVDNIIDAITRKFGMLGTSDMEREVKESAVISLTSVISLCGNMVRPATFKDKCLPVVSGALDGAGTRSVALRTLVEISTSPVKMDISSIADSSLVMLVRLMKDSNKQMRQSSLAAAAAVLKHETGTKSVSEGHITDLLNEVHKYISDSDLYLSHLAINAAANAIACCCSSAVKDAFSKLFMPQIDLVLKSQALQGAILSSLKLCFCTCGSCGVFPAPSKTVDHFHQLATTGDVPKQVASSIANICATYIKGVPDDGAKKESIKKLVDIAEKPASPASQSFAMLAIGYVGCEFDLAGHLKVILDEIAIPAFAHGTDDIRSSAKFMLGGVMNGSVSTYVPAVINWSKKASEGEQYYVLASLQEFASRLVETNNVSNAEQVSETVIGVIKALIGTEDEGKRNVAWDCMGKLCALVPSKICPIMLAMVSDKSKELRTIVAGAIRVMYSNVLGGKGCASWQTANRPVVTRFIFDNASALFALLQDGEVQVRRQILLTTNYILHQNSSELIPEEVMKTVVAPYVLKETEIRPELIEEIQIGPHKDIQDHGLEARKAAFDCLSSLLDSYPGILEAEALLSHLAKGLKDNSDIILVAIQISIKLASSFMGAALVPHVDKELTPVLDSIVFPMSTGKKLTEEAIQRQEEEKRHVMRLIAVMVNIPGIIAGAPTFARLLNVRILPAPGLSKLYKEAEQSLSSDASQNPSV